MLDIKKINGYHITSEPGDSTRYSFLIYFDDNVIITPVNSSIIYPETLTFFDFNTITTLSDAVKSLEIRSFSRIGEVNPHTT